MICIPTEAIENIFLAVCLLYAAFVFGRKFK